MFDTLQDRLAATFKSLRGKGRITEADIDETAREIRRLGSLWGDQPVQSPHGPGGGLAFVGHPAIVGGQRPPGPHAWWAK